MDRYWSTAWGLGTSALEYLHFLFIKDIFAGYRIYSWHFLQRLKNVVTCPYVFRGFKCEIHCHSLSKCCFPVGKVSFLSGCFQDLFFPLEVWLWHFLAWISLGLSCHDSRSFMNQICRCMPFAKFGEISSYYVFEFFSPTLFLVSSGTLVMQILEFLWLPHMVLGFFSLFFLYYRIG